MFYKIVAYTPNKEQWKETVTIIRNLATSANLVRSIAEDLMYELLEEVPEAEFVSKWENQQDAWYASCTYEGYAVDLDLEDCELYDIAEDEWYEETGLWSEGSMGQWEEDAKYLGMYERF